MGTQSHTKRDAIEPGIGAVIDVVAVPIGFAVIVAFAVGLMTWMAWHERVRELEHQLQQSERALSRCETESQAGQ